MEGGSARSRRRRPTQGLLCLSVGGQEVWLPYTTGRPARPEDIRISFRDRRGRLVTGLIPSSPHRLHPSDIEISVAGQKYYVPRGEPPSSDTHSEGLLRAQA